MRRSITAQHRCQAMEWLQCCRISQAFAGQTQHRLFESPGHNTSRLQNRCSSSSVGSPSADKTSSCSSGSSRGIPWHLQDQILLRGLTFHGYHGALPEENVLGQKFVVDATLWADLAAAGHSDELQDTIDYSKAYSVIQQVVQGPARILQEAVAEDVCQQLLQLDPRVSAVQVYIRKPHVALTGVLDSVGIQIFRTRK